MNRSSRRLLMLGSNLPDDARVHAALARLQSLGPVDPLGPVRHLRPRGGNGAWYYNVLVVLDSPLGEPELQQSLAGIERALGRRRGGDEVAIDIDLLATEADGSWQASRRATVKGELGRWPANRLLEDCGIRIGAS